jgi:uncharacterized protein
MDIKILTRIEQYNPWLADPGSWPGQADKYLPVKVVPRARQISLPMDKTQLVTGPRQAGKSTLVWLHLSQLKLPPLYINLDDPGLRTICDSGAGFTATLKPDPQHLSAIFFDEIQQLEEAGQFLKSLVDLRLGLPIVATGSSSFHLRSRTRESLAGRASRLLLYPFSHAEVSSHVLESSPAYRHETDNENLVDSMLLYGSYPAVWCAPDDSARRITLLDLVDTLVLRDASDAYRIRNPQAFRMVLRLAAGQVGNLVNMSEYASLAGVSVSTTGDYLAIMEDSHIVRRVQPFLGGKRAEVTSRPKIFFVDNGLRNMVRGGFTSYSERGDRGPLFENLVFSELLKSCHVLDELLYWRTQNGAEVDFVLRRGDMFIPLEVKASKLSRCTVSRSLRSFIKAYHPPIALIINPSLDESMQIDNTQVRFIPFTKLAQTLHEVHSA